MCDTPRCGEPVIAGLSDGTFPRYFQELIDVNTFSSATLKKMSGNAFHMVSFGAFMMYCMSRTSVKADIGHPLWAE